MSTGAVYIASNNDGQMDELLYMTGLLSRRIGEIRAARMKTFMQMQQSGQDVSNFAVTPTITDILASHNLLPSKTYRPYVTTTFQYLKHRITTGSGALGGESTFQMRTFGEFLGDTMLYLQTSPVYSADVSLQTLVLANQATLLPTNKVVGPSATYTPALGTALGGMNGTASPVTAVAAGVNTWYYNTIEDANGTVLMDSNTLWSAGSSTLAANMATAYPTTILVRDYVRYFEYPVHAMILNVSFQINSTPIDSYTQERDNFHILYLLPTNKVQSYYKCVGQELPLSGYSDLITNYTVPSDVTIPGYATGQVVTARKRIDVMTGYQTPAYQQPALTGLYPNKFDHCRDVSNAIPILAIPNTDRTFVYTFAPQTSVVAAVPANLFAVQTQIAYTLVSVATAQFNATHITSTTTKTPITAGGALSTLSFSILQMYMNNLFVDPSVHDIYLERIGFSLTRVHRIQAVNVNTSTAEVTLTSFKWPLEFMFIGLRPSTNLTSQPYNNWWKFTYNTPMTGTTKVKSTSVYLGGAFGDAPAEVYLPQTSICTPETIYYNLPARTVDTLQITLQTIPLYEVTDASFFNSYMPYTYGGYNISGGAETSSMFVTFNFYPADNGSPSGHVNVSRSREFMINIASSVVGSGNLVASGTLHCVGIVINFWVASSGNLFLRFT